MSIAKIINNANYHEKLLHIVLKIGIIIQGGDCG